METSILRQQDQPEPPADPLPEPGRALILVLWAVLLCSVVVGSLLPAASPVMVAVGRRGLMAGLSMFLLGVLMEAGQHFSPNRVVEFGDVLANGAGVSCGTLIALL